MKEIITGSVSVWIGSTSQNEILAFMVSKGNFVVAWALSELKYIINTAVYNEIAFYGNFGMMSKKPDVVFIFESQEKLHEFVYRNLFSTIFP